jgi:hypothetical protein
MSHAYEFDLKLFATVPLESRRKVEEACNSASIEMCMGDKKIISTASRDGGADFLVGNRSRASGKLQVVHCFDVLFFVTIKVNADSVTDARKHVAEATMTVIVNIDGEQVRVGTEMDGEPDLLEIDGGDPRIPRRVALENLICVGGTLMSEWDYAADFCARLDELESRDHLDYPSW